MSPAPESSGEESDVRERRTLLDTIMHHRGRGGSVAVICMVVGIVGLLMGGRAALGLLAEPWELDASSPVVASVDSECGPFTGARYVIEVEGEERLCGGSDTKCGGVGPTRVAFDPEEPSRCRVAANVDRLGTYELQILILTLGFLAIGTAGATYSLSERLRLSALLRDAPERPRLRSLLRRCSGLALLVAVALTNGFAIYFLLMNA